MEVHKHYNLRSKETVGNPPMKIWSDAPSTTQTKDDPQSDTSQKHDVSIKEVDKPQTSFSIENELVKVKISIPIR